MKIEGMQYPLPVRPSGNRSGLSHNDVEISDDAVYFEPEERRQKNQQQGQEPSGQDSEPQSHQKLEDQISGEKIQSAEAPKAALKNDTAEARPHLNIIV